MSGPDRWWNWASATAALPCAAASGGARRRRRPLAGHARTVPPEREDAGVTDRTHAAERRLPAVPARATGGPDRLAVPQPRPPARARRQARRHRPRVLPAPARRPFRLRRFPDDAGADGPHAARPAAGRVSLASGADALLWVTSLVDEASQSIRVVTWEDEVDAEGVLVAAALSPAESQLARAGAGARAAHRSRLRDRIVFRRLRPHAVLGRHRARADLDRPSAQREGEAVMIGTTGLQGLRVECIVGIHPHEREARQSVILDIELDYDFARGGDGPTRLATPSTTRAWPARSPNSPSAGSSSSSRRWPRRRRRCCWRSCPRCGASSSRFASRPRSRPPAAPSCGWSALAREHRRPRSPSSPAAPAGSAATCARRWRPAATTS